MVPVLIINQNTDKIIDIGKETYRMSQHLLDPPPPFVSNRQLLANPPWRTMWRAPYIGNDRDYIGDDYDYIGDHDYDDDYQS